MTITEQLKKVISGRLSHPNHVMEDGLQAETLRNNEYVNQAIANLKVKYIIAEDTHTGDPHLTAQQKSERQTHFSMLRLTCDAFIADLDEAVMALEQAKDIHQEELNKERPEAK